MIIKPNKLIISQIIKHALPCFLLLVFSGGKSNAQTVDVAPSKYQNYLPVEGGSFIMKIDSVTSLDSLVARLSGNWEFLETGKGYWIGYTNDMFSIAARGEAAIPPLLNLFEQERNKQAKYGAIYTLHLLGINRTIEGRFSEKFINFHAREALLQLLRYPEWQEVIMRLLIRDPWLSDVPVVMNMLKNCQVNCWPLVNGLAHYPIKNTPMDHHLPSNLSDTSFSVVYKKPQPNDNASAYDMELKSVLYTLKKMQHKNIQVEEGLFNSYLVGDLISEIEGDVNFGWFIWSLDLDDYCSLGCRFQYYLENNVVWFCTTQTAQARWINWWNKRNDEEKAQFIQQTKNPGR